MYFHQAFQILIPRWVYLISRYNIISRDIASYIEKDIRLLWLKDSFVKEKYDCLFENELYEQAGDEICQAQAQLGLQKWPKIK